jgi:hypothetical protein
MGTFDVAKVAFIMMKQNMPMAYGAHFNQVH